MLVKIRTGKKPLVGFLEKPKRKSDQAVIFLPGFLDSSNYASFVQFSKELVKLNFTALRFDPTGTWANEGRISDYTISQYLSDVTSSILFLKKQNSKLKKIVLIGHSLGGMVAILYAARHKNIGCVVAIMPAQSLIRVNNKDARAKWKKEQFKTSVRDHPEKPSEKIIFKVPYSFVKDAQKYSALKEISTVKCPILLITGKQDTVTLPQSVEELFQKANASKEFVVLDQVGHDFRHSQKETKRVSKVIQEFVRKR